MDGSILTFKTVSVCKHKFLLNAPVTWKVMCGTKQYSHRNTDLQDTIGEMMWMTISTMLLCCCYWFLYMYSKVIYAWESPWFSILPVLCLMGLYTVIILCYLFKWSLYSCQSITCLWSTVWKKDSLLLIVFSCSILSTERWYMERYVCVLTYIHVYIDIHTICLHLCGPWELWRWLFTLQLLPENWL